MLQNRISKLKLQINNIKFEIIISYKVVYMYKNYCNKYNCVCNCHSSYSIEKQIRYICENEYDFF